MEKLQIFNELETLYNSGNQTALAEFYGRQEGMKSTVAFLIKRTDKDTGISFYSLNKPAQLNCKYEFQFYTRLMQNTDEMVRLSYTYPLLEGTPKILNYNEDIRNFNMETAVQIYCSKMAWNSP